MNGLLFAMPPPGTYTGWAVMVALLVVVATVFTSRTKDRRNRWWRFSLLSLGVGPLLGIVAVIAHFGLNGGTFPDDAAIAGRVIAIGFIGGVIGAVAFGVAALFTRALGGTP